MAILRVITARGSDVDSFAGGGDNGGMDDTLRADVAVLKADVSTLKADVSALKIDVGALKSDVSALKTDIATLGVRLDTVLPTLATNSDMHKEFHLQTWRLAGSMLAAAGIIIAGMKFLH